MKTISIILLFGTCLSYDLLAQDPLAQQSSDVADPEAPQRVQYTLILPDEKTPELIKAEENNPFEVSSSQVEKEGDTEENRVRDILISMQARGGGSGPTGMRVMLGTMRLEVGQEVPKIIPDQQVLLRVKSITAEFIELVWVEKTPTGLPPKPFVIPVDVSPSVRYRMPSGTGEKGQIKTGTLRRSEIISSRRSPDSEMVAETNTTKPVVKAVSVDEPPATAKIESPPASNVPEASVLRMLFGNHGPQPK